MSFFSLLGGDFEKVRRSPRIQAPQKLGFFSSVLLIDTSAIPVT